jgi:hypothetical protein
MSKIALSTVLAVLNQANPNGGAAAGATRQQLAQAANYYDGQTLQARAQGQTDIASAYQDTTSLLFTLLKGGRNKQGLLPDYNRDGRVSADELAFMARSDGRSKDISSADFQRTFGNAANTTGNVVTDQDRQDIRNIANGQPENPLNPTVRPGDLNTNSGINGNVVQLLAQVLQQLLSGNVNGGGNFGGFPQASINGGCIQSSVTNGWNQSPFGSSNSGFFPNGGAFGNVQACTSVNPNYPANVPYTDFPPISLPSSVFSQGAGGFSNNAFSAQNQFFATNNSGIPATNSSDVDIALIRAGAGLLNRALFPNNTHSTAPSSSTMFSGFPTGTSNVA